MTADLLPDVSVIIVSWNTRALTHACLASLPDAAGTLSWDAWVIDNASTDDSVEATRREFPHVRLIANTANVGFAAANNQGIRASSGRYVLLLNSDTVMDPGSLQRLVQFADSRPRVGVVGPTLVNPDGSLQSGPTPFPSLWTETMSVTGIGRRVRFRGYPSRGPRGCRVAQRTDYVMGACMLARRDAVDAIGGLDEAYFMYSEETDWCWRMREGGWETWFDPGARVVHHGGQSTGQIRDAMIVALYRSKVRFFALHKGRFRAAMLRGVFVAARRLRRVARWLRGLPPGTAVSWRDLAPYDAP